MKTSVLADKKPAPANIRLFTTDHPDIPVPNKERILFLDILRGIAIFFILSANIQYLSGEYFIPEAQKALLKTASLDYVIEILAFIFVDGKFYSVFSILFGIGFAVQYQRMNKDDKVFVPLFRRRMLGLLIIGSTHLFLIWLGDILTLYALVGFTLIWFRKFSDKRLLIWTGILLLMPVVHWLAMYLTDNFYPGYFFRLHDKLASMASTGIADGQKITRFSIPDYMAITSIQELLEVNLLMPLRRLGGILWEGRLFKVLALFLLGIWAGRQILERNMLSNTALLKKTFLWGIVIGLPMNLLRTWVEFGHFSAKLWPLAEFALNALALTPMAVAYCAAVAIVVTHRPHWLGWLAPVGRTALSNYLFQSLICIFIFYGIGLGFGGTMGYSAVVLVALVLFGWQVIFSTIWLNYFRFGPVEWLWRQLTYGKRVKLWKPIPTKLDLTG
ncbi:MAG: DUF418 domain-containing protein [Bacteroidetes bacterium]|nr:DUF418 domain-containing protein [Bacteroidota bacterium]MBU1578211.1 DUF418 domain-containing protein [Bacteroidota bacterium]MBU2466262.1 DUF418 domain-containing protein [Bacteroidota bacterium]MBU2557000.1 DUF418 domain-containing protein [Bacteroidota bacterium]